MQVRCSSPTVYCLQDLQWTAKYSKPSLIPFFKYNCWVFDESLSLAFFSYVFAKLQKLGWLFKMTSVSGFEALCYWKKAKIYNSQGHPNREHLRDNWLTAFAMLNDLIQPLISEEMKEWSESVFNQIAPWEQEVCNYFVLIHESQFTVLESYVQLKRSRFSQLPETRERPRTSHFLSQTQATHWGQCKEWITKTLKGMQKTNWNNLDVQSFRDQILKNVYTSRV